MTQNQLRRGFVNAFPLAMLLILFADTLTYPVGLPDLEVERIPEGRILRLQLRSAPFPHPGRQAGFTFEGTHYPPEPHYQDSTVAVFVPKNYQPAGPANLVFFFHGWNSSIEAAQADFDLCRQFAQSGVNALLVVPELARDVPDSFAGKLEDKNGFARLVKELLAVLASSRVIDRPEAGHLVLSGHSGAFRVVGQILMRGGLADHIDEVYLFDALYAWTDVFGRWIQERHGRFVSVDIPGTTTSKNADALAASLRSAGIKVSVGRDDPKGDARAFASPVVFLRSPYYHGGVVSMGDEFRRFLATSPLLRKRSP